MDAKTSPSKKVYTTLVILWITCLGALGQTNLAINGASALASDETSGGEAALAFDGDTATGWIVTSSPVQWLQYDLGGPIAVDGYAMHFLVDTTPAYQPVSWTFQGSNNGTDWTTLDAVSDNAIFMEWEQFITSNTEAYQYYRLDITAAGADTLAIGEFQLYVIETPTVITGLANYVQAEEASCNGNVVKNGGSPVLQRGICYNTTGYPTLAHSYRTSSAGIGSYNTMINNLSPNTLYYFRAYATNDRGTSYGPVVNTFVTLKLDQTISFDAMPDKVYGDADFDPGATASSGLAVSYASSNTGVATIVGDQVHIVGAGTATITASQEGDQTHYAATPTSHALTISRKELVVSANDTSRTYGETNPAFTISYSGFAGSDDANVIDTEPFANCAADVMSNAGSYFITPSGGSDNNYTFSYIPGYLTVEKAPLEIIVDQAEKIYGDPNPAFSWIYSGFVNNDDASDIDALPEATTTADLTSDAGTYPVNLTGGGDNNYAFVITAGTLTIQRAALTCTADDQAKPYGSANPELSTHFSGFKNGDDVSDLDTVPLPYTLADEFSEAGEYPIAIDPRQDNNYEISCIAGILTVEKAFLNATVEDVSRYVGEANPTFEIVYTGFVNDDSADDIDTSPVANCIADESSPAGNYAIEVSGGEDNNYFILTYNAILTVENRPDAIEDPASGILKVFPNPVREMLTIVPDQEGTLNIRLISITGNIVMDKSISGNRVDLSSVPSGIYLLTLAKGDRIIFRDKLIKE